MPALRGRRPRGWGAVTASQVRPCAPLLVRAHLLCVGLFACDEEPQECKNGTDLGKSVQMVPIHLGSLRLGVGRMQPTVQNRNETHGQVMEFTNSDSYLM